MLTKLLKEFTDGAGPVREFQELIVDGRKILDKS